MQTVEELALIPFDAQAATEDDWVRFTRFLNIIAAEELPDDPPVSVDDRRTAWTTLPPILRRRAWQLCLPDGHIVAQAQVDFIEMEENKHLAQARIAVLPEYRRQRLGSRLLAEIARATAAAGRHLLIMNTTSMVPAGELFVKAMGAGLALEAATNQLVIADVDHNLLQRWAEKGRDAAANYRLGFWDGLYPEEALPQVTIMKRAMNEQPMDDLAAEDIEWTPDLVRQMDQSLFQRKIERWTLHVEEQTTGNLAGYTEMLWSLSKPLLGQQGDTAVLQAHRNQGLGRWLKAEMLLKVLSEKPATTHVRTGNANSNAPMLKINHELGFRRYMSDSIWQAPLATVQAYLDRTS